MKRKNKGFTLIELLAVIVILGLLMAIAIPSVTKYITQSRKKTVTTTIGNYMSALTSEVNNMEYIFTATNTVYAVPIECIALERGGTNPFGEWMQASNSYWAYVLVQYDDTTSSYTYGFTFKDSAGYGLYPTATEKLNESGKQILTDLELTRPTNGTITNITAKANWTGFDIEDNTNLIVLEAESEGIVGDGKTTCTLCQKGSNYDAVEQEKKMRLSNLIMEHNTVITSIPTLTTSSNNTSDESGLYVSTATNSGNPTYYFRGNVTNNYVSFADMTWRIVRINEDKSVRIFLESQSRGWEYSTAFSRKHKEINGMYYSDSELIKNYVEDWYNKKLSKYDNFITTNGYCEQIKVKAHKDYSPKEIPIISEYTPDFKCFNDINAKGLLNLKIGLITLDEAIFAGAYVGKENKNFYLASSGNFYVMSPSGFSGLSREWQFVNYSLGDQYVAHARFPIHPVINLNTTVMAKGTGTKTDPYVIQIN